MTWWQRLRNRDRLERELDAELRYHFDRHVEDNIRSGMPEAEARRMARLELGGEDQVKSAVGMHAERAGSKTSRKTPDSPRDSWQRNDGFPPLLFSLWRSGLV